MVVVFEVGQKVEHILNKEWLLVLYVNDSQIKCRTKSLDERWFDGWELKVVNEDEVRKM